MTVLRLFIAIELPEPIKAQLIALMTDIPGAAWVKPATLHLTLRFVGDGIAQAQVSGLIAALDGIQAAPFELALAGMGRFPPVGREPALVLWAGLQAPHDLPKLADAVDQTVVALGFPPDDHRPYTPHVTLAWLDDVKDGSTVTRFLAAHAGLRSEPFAVVGFSLISSQLSPQGPQYTRLHRVALTAG